MAEAFGFKVRQEDTAWRDGEHGRTAEGGPFWRVYLPHQCDSWDIAGEGFDGGVPHEEAVAEMERFVAEATAALEALRERRDFTAEDSP